MFRGLLIVAASLVASVSSAQIPAYSGDVTIGPDTIPLVLCNPSGVVKGMYGGRGDAPARYDANGRSLIISRINAANVQEINGTCILLTTFSGFCGEFTCRYECPGPIGGTLTMNLVGTGVWLQPPSTITLAHGTVMQLPN